VKPGRFPFLRVSTDELEGKIKGYAGEGASTDDPLETFGVYGVSQVDNLQQLLRFICENGYENHVAMDMPQSADAIQEALNNEMGWKI
jgi:L-fucose isomerase-like protein